MDLRFSDCRFEVVTDCEYRELDDDLVPLYFGIICVFQCALHVHSHFPLFEHLSIVFSRVVFAMEFTTLIVSVGYDIIHLSSYWPFAFIVYVYMFVRCCSLFGDRPRLWFIWDHFSIDSPVYRRITMIKPLKQ